MHVQVTKQEGSDGGFLSYCGLTRHVFVWTGLLESSMRLKPHEAQSYRKKALYVSWVSIVVTIILAIAAFSESLLVHLPSGSQPGRSHTT